MEGNVVFQLQVLVLEEKVWCLNRWMEIFVRFF